MSLLWKTLLAAFAVMFLLVLVVATGSKQPTPVIPTLDIGVEHTGSSTLTITVTRNDTLRMIDIGNDGQSVMKVSVPQHWKRAEVRGIALKAVKEEPPSFQYVRFTFPPHADITFTSQLPFQHLRIQNPSGKLLKIRSTSVDLQKNTSAHDVYLLKEGSLELP